MRKTTPKIEIFDSTKTIVFQESQIKSCKIHEEIDLLSDKLVPKTCEFSIFLEQADWEVFSKRLKKFLKLQVSVHLTDTVYGIDGTKSLGIFYINSWEREINNVSRIKASGFLAVLDTKIARGSNIYIPPNQSSPEDFKVVRSVSQWIETFFSGLNVSYVLDPSFINTYLTGTLMNSTRKERLQHVAFAIGAVVEEDRNGVFQIYPKEKSVSYEIEENRMISPIKETKINPISTLKIDIFSYLSFNDANPQPLFNGNLATGSQYLYFNEPVQSYTTLPSSVTALARSPWFIQFNVITAGDYEFTGTNFQEVINSMSYQNPKNSVENSIEISENRLITSYNVDSLAEKIFDYYNFYTEILEFKYISNGEEVGFFGSFQISRNSFAVGTIVSQDIDVSGGLITSAKAQISGFKKNFGYYTGQKYFTNQKIGLI